MRFKKDFQGTITLPMTEANVMFFELLKWQAIFSKAGIWVTYTPRNYNPSLAFRKYAAEQFKRVPPELTEALGRFAKAVKDATATAEKLGDAYRRYYAAQRARHWRPRSWKRKGW